MVEHGVEPSVGFCWQELGLNGVRTSVWLLVGDTVYQVGASVVRDNVGLSVGVLSNGVCRLKITRV